MSEIDERLAIAAREGAAERAGLDGVRAPLIVFDYIDGPSHVHPDGNPAPCPRCAVPVGYWSALAAIVAEWPALANEQPADAEPLL